MIYANGVDVKRTYSNVTFGLVKQFTQLSSSTNAFPCSAVRSKGSAIVLSVVVLLGSFIPLMNTELANI
jgi:hypothetical protein